MAPKIKVRGAGRTATKPVEEAPKPTRRSSTRKSASPKRQPAKREAPAAPAKPTAKRGPGRPRKSATATAAATAPTSAPVQRRNSTGVDPRTEAKVLKLVEKMGERRAKAEAEHQEAINSLHEAATEALEAGVSMAKVSDASGISRQWLYKMGDFRGRGNGGNGNGSSKPAAKPAAKSTAKTPAKRTSARKSTTTRQATKTATGGSRRRVAIRSAG